MIKNKKTTKKIVSDIIMKNGESFIFIIIPFIFQLQNYYIHVLIAALKNVLCVIFLNKKNFYHTF